MKISWSKEGGRVVSKAWDAGRRGKGILDVGVSFIPRISKTGWVFPRCRADGSRKAMVRERYMLANSVRFSRRECRVGASSTSGRRLDVLDGQNQVGKEGKFRYGPRTGKDLRSFAEVVVAPLVVGSDRLAPRAFGKKDGRMSVSFSSSEVAAGEQKFKTSVVLRFFKRRPLADHLKTFIESRWKIVGRFSFSELWDSNHVIVLLENETDVRKALSCQLSKVGSCAFKAFRWFSEYDPRQKQKSFKTWISLPDLPLCLFDKSYVESIISGFAKFLFIDEKSERCTNLRCMRARIEVVDREVIPDKMWIKLPKGRGYWQFFQVEEVSRSERKVEDPAIVNFPAKEDEFLSDTDSRPCFDVAAGFQTKPLGNLIVAEEGSFGSINDVDPTRNDALGDGSFGSLIEPNVLDGTRDYDHVEYGSLGSLNGVDPTRRDAQGLVRVESDVSAASDIPIDNHGTSTAETLCSPIHPTAVVVGLRSMKNLTPCSNAVHSPISQGSKSHDINGKPNATAAEASSLNPIAEQPQSKGTAEQQEDTTAGSPFGRLAPLVGQSKTAPCDSIELLKKKMGKRIYEKEVLEANEGDLAPKVVQKIAKYGSHIFYDHGAPINARDYYLGVKALYGDKDAHIFRVMDIIYDAALQNMNEGSHSSVEKDDPSEDSDGSIDLSRILKPRQKSKGSGKKKGSNVVY